MSYKRVKQNYIDGLWTRQMVKQAYYVGIITLAQYKEIIALPQAGSFAE